MSFDGTFNLPIADHVARDNAPTGYIRFMVGSDGVLRTKNSSGTVTVYATGISPEEVQDIVGAFIASSSSINATYDDNGNILSFTINQSSIDHGNISNLLADHHTQYLNNTRGDARYYTKSANDILLAQREPSIVAGLTTQYWRGDKTWQVLPIIPTNLSSFTNDANFETTTQLNNRDIANRSRANHSGTQSATTIVEDITHRFVTDTEKTIWNAKEPAIVNPNDVSKYYRGDKTWATFPNIPSVLSELTNDANFETTTQLNSRDTANRSRANHSGTQLVNTISDFLSGVMSSVLTGISFATNSAILATDTLLVALGKIQSQLNNHFGSGGTVHALATTSIAGFMSSLDKTKLDGIISDVILFVSTALTNTSNVTFVTIPILQIPVIAGNRYIFKANIIFDSASTATGIGLSIGGTATGTLRAVAEAPISNTAGTTNKISGPINALNGVVTTTAVGAIGTQYMAEIEGVFTASANGFIYPQFRSEVNGSQIRVNIDSCMVYKEY